MTRGALLACSAVVAAGCVSAAPIGVLSSDRPGFSDSPAIIPKGRFQLETGYTYTEISHGNHQSFGEVLVRSGLARRIELRTHLNSYALESKSSNRAEGIEDSKVGIKYLVVPQAKAFLPVLSLIAQTSLPTGSNAFTANKPIPEAKIAATWSGKSPLSLTVNAGINFGETNARDDFAFVTAAPWMTLTHSLSAFAELYSGQTQQVDGGVSWLLSHRAQIDLRLGSSISSSSQGSFFGAGFVSRW